MSASSTFAARALVTVGLLLWGLGQAAAVCDQTPMAASKTPTPSVNRQVELYRNAVQEVTTAEVEHRKLLEAASEALVQYQKAVKASVDTEFERKQPKALGATQAKILELVSAAGFAVAAIFFGFFGVIVAPMPGLPDGSPIEKQVKTLYWKMAHANAVGIVLSMSASMCAMVAIGASSLGWAWCAIVLGALAAGLMVGITAYFEVQIWQRNWHL